MCGICGVVGMERADDTESVVRRMMAAMGHRGPDDEGLFLSPPVALGARRLSIIDLVGGHQPIFNEEGTAAVVFNGEIYNFLELRRALEAGGHRFRTSSDTETIVHAYEAWGQDCVHHLRGMFAFAVLDKRRNGTGHKAATGGPSVFLARDRLGIKPLHYAWVKGELLFASEVRALMASQRISPRLSLSALESYLLFGSVAEPMTLVEGIFSLPPGHRMLVPLAASVHEKQAAQSCAPCPEPYWDFAEAALRHSQDRQCGSRTTTRGLRPLLEDVVRSHLTADAPLGLFLSSGLDSTALVALASREQSVVHTFTVVFPESEFSEAELARRTAERFGTQHQELMLGEKEMLARFREAIGGLDQPSMDGINTYFVSWAARQVGLKVALSGLGGDELFGGYSTFAATPRARRLAALGCWVPPVVRSATASAVAQACSSSLGADAARKLAALWRHADGLPHPHFFVRGLFTPEQSSRLLAGTAPTSGAPESPWRWWLKETARQAERLDPFTAVSCLEMRSYMVHTLLRDTDAVSMSQSLEVRVPLLDHRLVEFVAQLPEGVKRRLGKSKALLVEALEDLLPAAVVRQHKRTFTFPWERWLRGALGQEVAAGLADLAPALEPVLNREAVSAVWRDFLFGRTSWSRPWSLYVLNQWCKWHLEGHRALARAAVPAIAHPSATIGHWN